MYLDRLASLPALYNLLEGKDCCFCLSSSGRSLIQEASPNFARSNRAVWGQFATGQTTTSGLRDVYEDHASCEQCANFHMNQLYMLGKKQKCIKEHALMERDSSRLVGFFGRRMVHPDPMLYNECHTGHYEVTPPLYSLAYRVSSPCWV